MSSSQRDVLGNEARAATRARPRSRGGRSARSRSSDAGRDETYGRARCARRPAHRTRLRVARSPPAAGSRRSDCRGSGVSSGRCSGTRARNTGTRVASSARASRRAASSARAESAWATNGNRMRRVEVGRGRGCGRAAEDRSEPTRAQPGRHRARRARSAKPSRGLPVAFARSGPRRTAGRPRAATRAAGTAAPAASGDAARCAGPGCPSGCRSCRAPGRCAGSSSRCPLRVRSAGGRRGCSPAGAAPRSARARIRSARGRSPTAGRARRPSRCAERHARRTTRCDLGLRGDQREQAFADRLGRGRVEQTVLPAPAAASVGIRLASTSSATCRSATSRSADRFSILKKLFSAAWTRSPRVDLPGDQPFDQRLRGDVDQNDIVGGG